MRLHLLLFFPAVALLSSLVTSSKALCAEKTVEELLDDLNRLPAAERATALADGAKKEGELVWYSTMNRENSVELSQAFEKDHPYVSVKILSGSAVNTMTRITSEFRAT